MKSPHARRAAYPVRTLPRDATLWDAISLHWPEYLMEGAELGIFMLSACAFATLLFYDRSPAMRVIPNGTARLVLMGVAMGATAIGIVRSPMGRRSGAHFNPVISVTFLFLGKMHRLDTLFYVIAHFLGGPLGVLLAWFSIGAPLASPSVRFVVTIPGSYGVLAAFCAECFMGWLMITVVLYSGNSARLSRFTWLFVGLLVMMYVIAFSAVSGFSVNPARTFSSAIFARIWTALWLYFSAPLLGMLTAAEVFRLHLGQSAVRCAKIYHDLHSPCPFHCSFQEML